MNRRFGRFSIALLVWGLAVAIWMGDDGSKALAETGNWTVPPAPPLLKNADFECEDGYTTGVNAKGEVIHVPDGWTLVNLEGRPVVASTRLMFAKVCDRDDSRAFIERLNRWDSLIVLSEDIETPPTPGKPFDVALYQRVPTLYGAAYSLSGWMISLCGTKSRPFNCPPENFIIKRIGLDPLGGTDPNASSIVWIENRRNFVDAEGNRVGWQNMSVATVALTDTMTVFVRMTSPFQFHGNMGFVDAFSLIRAPLARLLPLPEKVTGQALELGWETKQSDDVLAIRGGAYQLMVDVQARALPDGAWRDVAVGLVDSTSIQFVPRCWDRTYAFRIRARTEQSGGGVWPNQRYPGAWTTPQRVQFVAPRATSSVGEVTGIHLPLLAQRGTCE